MNKTIFGTITTILLLFVFVTTIQQQQYVFADKKIEGYDIYKEKMLPKCLEFNEAGSLDLLKNYDTQLWSMCLDFMLEDDIKIKD